MKRWRVEIVSLAVVVVASACSSGDDSFDDAPPPTDGSSPDVATTQGVQASPDGLRGALTDAGIEIIDSPGEAPVTGLQLWTFQVENLEREMEAGGGYLGEQLDELAGSPGGMPFSYLIAGWLDAAPTPIAESALGLMGEQPWEQAPSLVFPSAVLVLFVADAVEAAGGVEGTAMPTAELVSLAQGGPCSALAEWVNQVLDYVFESLKVETDGGGFFDWLGVIWNAALDLARGLVEGLIELLTAPIVKLITDALAVIHTLNMVAQLLVPWHLEVTPSNTETRFAVGDGPDIEEFFVAEVDTRIDFTWPNAVQDCASVAGLNLPDPSSAEGSEVTWRIEGAPPLGALVTNQNVIDEDNETRLDWVTGREESDEGEAHSGTVSVDVRVVSKQIEELKAMLSGLITGQIPVKIFADIVGEMFSALTAPIFDALAELVQVSGNASVTVVYHDEKEEEPTTGSAACVVGTWRINNDDVLNLHGFSLGDVAEEVFVEGSVTAEFEEDGTVTYEFRGWTLGNTTYTESALPGVISDIEGEVRTESAGTATGTWSVAGETLTLIVADFDTSVVQKVVSYVLEIDQTINALPDLARLYVIPNGATRHICDEDILGVEWADGAGVRWFRS